MCARTLAIFFSVLIGLVTTVHAAEFNDGQRKEIESVAREYLLNNPEILQEMSQALEKKQKQVEDEQRKGALVANTELIFRDKADFVAGNPNGDVTIVEFFDYNCPWCKKSFADVIALIGEDKEVRVVLKEFPILGPDSEYASKAAIAAGYQGKYMQLHTALFQHDGRITQETVDELVISLGLDMERFKKDMGNSKVGDIVERNRALAQSLAINGTPAFIINEQLFPGYLPKEELQNAIVEARAKDACLIC